MKIVKLKGGLGNQMFQYAFAKMIEKATGEVVKIDYSAYADLKNDVVRVPRIKKFNLSLEDATQHDINKMCFLKHIGNSQSFTYKLGIYAEKTLNKKYFWEPDRSHREIDKLIDYNFFDGYWQSYKYVDEVFEHLKREFVPKDPISSQTQQAITDVTNENSVFVGVRRGDYGEEIGHYGSFSSDYYQKAMKYIDDRVENPVYYIFSNDIPWCKENLDFGNRNVIYREPSEQVDDFEELVLMSSCKHAIIVNSTYNWWGARLINNHQKIVCCPQKWFFDDKPISIIPENWKRIF